MDTLVLSNAYEPLMCITWKRAFALLFDGKAEVVEEYSNRVIRSVSQEFKVPSIIRFLFRLKKPKMRIRFSRQNVYVRDRGRCQYCNVKVSGRESTFDHVIPLSQGGTTRWDNIVISCVPCNQKKGGRTPEQARMRLLSVPSKPEKLLDVHLIKRAMEKEIPSSWYEWLRDLQYWMVELEQS